MKDNSNIKFKEEFLDTCLVDDTTDDYILVQFDNEDYDFGQSGKTKPYIYYVYDKDRSKVCWWQSEENALDMRQSEYLKSNTRKLFIRQVNIDRVSMQDVTDKDKKSSTRYPGFNLPTTGKKKDKWSTSYGYSGGRSIWGYSGYSGNDYYSSHTYISDDEALKKYGNSNTLCFHKTDRTTTMLTQIYEGRGWDVINDSYEMSHETLHKLIDSHERIVMLGHGTSGGLIGFIHDCCAEHLKGKKLFMLWCNADGYWAHHKDLGTGWYCTGNMPSDDFEARAVGYKVTHQWMDDNITYWCKLCGDVVEQCLEGDAKAGAKYIRDKYWEKYKGSEEPDQIGITVYNYQRTKTSGEDLIPAPSDMPDLSALKAEKSKAAEKDSDSKKPYQLSLPFFKNDEKETAADKKEDNDDDNL